MKTIAWHKDYNYQVPFNPLLEGNKDVEFLEVADDFDAEEFAVQRAAGGDHADKIVADVDEDEEPETDVTDELVEAIRALDPDERSHWTATGLPNSVHLSDVCDMRVNKEMRDTAWAKFNAES